MAYADVNISLDLSGADPEVTVEPEKIPIEENENGIKWESEHEFEIEIKDGFDLHFDMDKKSGKKKYKFKTKIKDKLQHTTRELGGSYAVRVFHDGNEYELDPDYIIRPRG